jgi:hypothetical protein
MHSETNAKQYFGSKLENKRNGMPVMRKESSRLKNHGFDKPFDTR